MTLNDLEFKAEDFCNSPHSHMAMKRASNIAARANYLLRDWLEKAPKFYSDSCLRVWSDEQDERDTHTARLVCVEEMK